jgi:pimeloyl-ACP methyl ester carboxylesterase
VNRLAARAAAALAAPARLSDAPLTPLDESVAMWPGHEVDVDGWRAYVRVTPPLRDDAEPALCVHGLGGSAHNWTDFAAVLRDRLAIESIDLPGFGRSAPPPEDRYSIDVFANRVIAYLEQSGRGPVHLIGNSLGGATSILVASMRPDLVRTLTLISPAVLDFWLPVHFLRNDKRVVFLLLPRVGEAAFRRLGERYPVDVRVRATIALCFHDPSRYPKARMEEAVAEAEARQSNEWTDTAFLRSIRAFARYQASGGRALWAAMRQITAPTAVLWGDDDRVIPARHAQRVARTIPDARLRVFERMGHVAMMEDPVATARAVTALLEDVASEAPA